MDLLNIFDKGSEIMAAALFNILHEILSKPEASFEGLLRIIFATLCTNMFKFEVVRRLFQETHRITCRTWNLLSKFWVYISKMIIKILSNSCKICDSFRIHLHSINSGQFGRFVQQIVSVIISMFSSYYLYLHLNC